ESAPEPEMWVRTPELAPAGSSFVANCGPAWVVIAPGGGAACRRGYWPHPGSDLCVGVVGAEVEGGAITGGAVRADQAGSAGRRAVDGGAGGEASCAPADGAPGAGQRGAAAAEEVSAKATACD